MRIEWVMWIDRGSCYDSLRQMTQGFCFTVFCISPPGISKGFSCRSRQAKIQTCLISHPIVNLAPVPESSPPQHSCPHLEQLVFFGSAQCSHHVWGPEELSLGSLAEQCPAWGGADVSSQPQYHRACRHRRWCDLGACLHTDVTARGGSWGYPLHGGISLCRATEFAFGAALQGVASTSPALRLLQTRAAAPNATPRCHTEMSQGVWFPFPCGVQRCWFILQSPGKVVA